MLSRREFAVRLSGAVWGLAVSGSRGLGVDALVIDANTAPPVNASGDVSAQQLAMIRDSGVRVCKTTMGGFGARFAEAVGEVAFWQRVIELHPDEFLQVRLASDIDRAQRERKLGIIFSFESVEMLEGRPDRINLFRNLGVRVMQLSYNLASPFGSGVLAKGGLTDRGRAAIAMMNETGVALDLSHSNEETSTEALRVTKRTPVISHGGCAAVHPHPRNKSDALLRAAAQRGAVLGIYMLPYLAPSPKQPTLDDYLKHMTHALRVMGEDHVGIGTDVGMTPFDTSPRNLAEFERATKARRDAGVAAPEEDRAPYLADANVPRKLELVASGLARRGYPARVVEKVLGLNFRRAFAEAWRD